jgi:DNA N-6-adenine-methyltransferase (Dam)
LADYTDRKGQPVLYDPSEWELHERPEVAHELPWLSSKTDEWWTPATVIELAREMMGSIDTDPASNAEANAIIKAGIYYTIDNSGLHPDNPWSGNVWLNPPYGSGKDESAQCFVIRLRSELLTGSVSQAITCLNLNSSCAHWFDTVWQHASAHCVWRGRINFYNLSQKKTAPSKGSIISYFGDQPDRFRAIFYPHGHVFS